MSVVELAVD